MIPKINILKKNEKNAWRHYPFIYMCTIKWRYDIWFLKYKVRQTENQPGKSTPEDIIILQMYTINDSHIMYGSWDMECNRQNFLSFWTIFCPFNPSPPPPSPPLTTQKIQNFEKMKKLPGDIIILHRCTINHNHIMFGSWDMECDEQNFLSFWTNFCPFTPLTTWKIKILKNWKNSLEILSFHTCIP